MTQKFDVEQHHIVCVDKDTKEHLHVSMPEFAAAEARYEAPAALDPQLLRDFAAMKEALLGLGGHVNKLTEHVNSINGAMGMKTGMSDLQNVVRKLDEQGARLSHLEALMSEACDRIDFITDRASSGSALTQDEVQ